MDKIRQKFTEINRRIFNLRDGEILQQQKEYGTIYKKSFGVAMVSLENIAKDYEPSHELAKLLWEFGGREQTLIASMLEEPEKVNLQELENYLLKTETTEAWEKITQKLVRKLPEIEKLISQWLGQKEEVLQIYAVLSLGYLPHLFTEEILQKMMLLEITENSYLEKCMQRILLKIGIRDEKVLLLLKENTIMQTKYSAVLDEIVAFFA
ncbi:MAG: DNA alkylation repair protein [Flavobacteriaceae bacterium]|nr:DNA alkylation repair protein [Flavobacteriaceae bacterium]